MKRNSEVSETRSKPSKISVKIGLKRGGDRVAGRAGDKPGASKGEKPPFLLTGGFVAALRKPLHLNLKGGEEKRVCIKQKKDASTCGLYVSGPRRGRRKVVNKVVDKKKPSNHSIGEAKRNSEKTTMNPSCPKKQ